MSPRLGPVSVADWSASKVVSEVVGKLKDKSRRCVGRAPGRLDIMGGCAGFSGSVVLNMATAAHVCVGVQRRDDGMVRIETVRGKDSDGSSPIELSVKALFDVEGRPIESDAGVALLENNDTTVARCVLGVFVELLRMPISSGPGGGVSIVVGSTMDNRRGLGRSAATVAATAVSVARAMDLPLDLPRAVGLCRRVESAWLNLPVAGGDAVCCLVGEPHMLMQSCLLPFDLGAPVPLPDDLVIIGLDCGVVHPDVVKKFVRVRTAAMMGRTLIDRIIRHENYEGQGGCDRLSQVSISDYVERFRDRIPTKLAGQVFYDRFGETGDELTRIEPGFTYKVRSRCEHQIYENARGRQFIEELDRAIRLGSGDILAAAGELMYSSHWSYGQRCGLGSIETDLLVNLIRGQGLGADIFGAKASGMGCGGVVTVLMRSTDCAWSAIDHVVDTYRSQTGRTAGIIKGSSPGALVFGAHTI